MQNREVTRMAFDQLATGVWLEGMALDGDTVLVSDVGLGGIRRLSRDGGVIDVWRENDRWIGGIMLNDDGKVLSSGAGGIFWFDPRTRASGTLIDAVEGECLRGVNEMVADSAGNLIFGTVDIPAFERKEAPGPCALFRLAVDGTVTRLADGLTFTNGLALSADGRVLFHNESFVGVFAYEIDKTGRLGTPRKLLDKPDCDGMKMDVQGRLWITGFRSNELTVLNPNNGQASTFPLPVGAATNVWFGGTDGQDIFVTTVVPVAVGAPDEVVAPTQLTSTLIRGRAPVAGRAVLRPKFRPGAA
jgi:sugar lactone lactonase YvrE